MLSETVHRVDGVGISRKSVDAPFNPKNFERAIHGLQDLLLNVPDMDKHETGNTAEFTTNDDGEKVAIIPEDDVLYTAFKKIPYRWDVTLVQDMSDNINNHALHAAVDCGGGVFVRATIMAGEYRDGGWTADLHSFQYTDPVDRETIHRESGNVHGNARSIRRLEKEVGKAYANNIEGIKAFDYWMTNDIRTSGQSQPRNGFRGDLQSVRWSEARKRTRQTISNNVSDARESLQELDEHNAFEGYETSPSLKESTVEAETDDDILVRLT